MTFDCVLGAPTARWCSFWDTQSRVGDEGGPAGGRSWSGIGFKMLRVVALGKLAQNATHDLHA